MTVPRILTAAVLMLGLSTMANAATTLTPAEQYSNPSDY